MADPIVLGDMTDDIAVEQIARIQNTYERWATRIGLTGWSIDNHYFRGGWTDSKHRNQWTTAAAETWADYRYRHAMMHWDLCQVKSMSDSKLERLILHELTHCLTDQFKQYACDEMPGEPSMPGAEMEASTTAVELAIWWAWEEGLAAERVAVGSSDVDELT